MARVGLRPNHPQRAAVSDSIPLGYYIRRTYKVPPHAGKTVCANSHRIYPTRAEAESDMAMIDDRRFWFDVAPVFLVS